MKGTYVIHGQRLAPRLQAHVLRHPLAAEGSAYLGWDGAWYPGAEKANAFVFPSFALAQRYAQSLMDDGLFVWMPEAVDFSSWLPGDAPACRDCGCIETFACPGGCAWHTHDQCSECAKPAPVSSWAVYDRPRDDPHRVIARRYIGTVPTELTLAGDSVEEVRAQLPVGLQQIARFGADDPALIETWL